MAVFSWPVWSYTIRRLALTALARGLAVLAAPWHAAGELQVWFRFRFGLRRGPGIELGWWTEAPALIARQVLDGESPSLWLPLLEAYTERCAPAARPRGSVTARDLAWGTALWAAYRLGRQDARRELERERGGE